MRFTKMNGLGNDYVYFDVRGNKNLHLTTENIKKICSRNFGIGADGVVLIQKSNKADCSMRIFNKDGSEAEICGNALRCVARFLRDDGYDSNVTIETLAGVKHAQVDANFYVSVNMGKPIFNGKIQPLKGVPIIGYSVSVGNPHFVVFSNNFDENFEKYASLISESVEIFPERTNVEFVKIVNDNVLQVRVFERGSGETLACGTGATAVYFVAYMLKLCAENAIIELKGGRLNCSVSKSGEIVVKGDANYNFLGEINLDGTN